MIGSEACGGFRVRMALMARTSATATGDPVTPFVVKVNGNNSFTVLAVGTPRTAYALGDNDVPFSATTTTIAVLPGQTIAVGFMDANPNGTGGTQPGIVTYQTGLTEIWHTGGTGDSQNGTVTVGAAPAVSYANRSATDTSGYCRRS